MGIHNVMAKTTTYKSINDITPAKIAPIDRIAAMHGDVQTTLASIGGAGNASLAYQILGAIDSTAAAICHPDHLALLDGESKASGTGFSFAFRFSKDGERKADKKARELQKAWSGLVAFALSVPLLKERVAKVHARISQKLAISAD